MSNNNDRDDWAPDISGSWIAWSGEGEADWGGNDWEIFLYDGESIRQLTDNDYYDSSPDISGQYVVWLGGYYDGPRQIFVYDGVSTTQLTDDNCQKSDVDISGSTIVWRAFDNDTGKSEIFMATLPEPGVLVLLLMAVVAALPTLCRGVRPCRKVRRA